MSPEVAKENERILAQVEEYGGGYVWEREIFAVTLMGVAVADAEAAPLAGLTGVQQIALNASRLSLATLQKLAGIPGLRSLVLSGITLTQEQQLLLEGCGPRVEVVEHGA
jgi:hypothetical protein